MMASRYAHAKQFKRHHRQLRLLRSRLGRIIRARLKDVPIGQCWSNTTAVGWTNDVGMKHFR